MHARIYWKRKEQGGRTRPPAGVGTPAYATVLRFRDSQEPWPPPNAWSLVVEKVDEVGDEFTWIAIVHYLVNEAPQNELRAGREFELYEGGKCVASGLLIDPTQLGHFEKQGNERA